MPLAEFADPIITDEYLVSLDKEQLLDLLRHKTNGLLVASRFEMTNSPTAKNLAAEVKMIQQVLQEDMK